MALVTVRPDSTPTGASNFTIFGGAPSINAALSDNNAGTYVRKGVTGNGAVIVGFATTSLASNVRVKQVRIRSQVLCPTTSSRLRITPVVRVDGVNYFGSAQTFSGSFIFAEYAAGYFTSAPDGQPWDQTRIDGLRAQIQDNATGVDLSDVYELFFDIETTTQPTVAVSNPTGTITNTTRPDVAWTYTDSDGSNQDYYEVRVFSAAQYSVASFDPARSDAVWESGQIPSDDNATTIDEHLVDGTTYRAYVRVAKSVSGALFYSAYAYSQFTVNTSPAGVPSFTTATYQSANNRVFLLLSASSVAGLFDSQVLELQRSDDLEASWSYVIDGANIVPNGLSASVYDYAAPRSTAVRYRTRSIGNSSGDLVASNWSSSASVSVSSDSTWWMKAVTAPALNRGSLRVVAPLEVKSDEQIGVFRPIGRSDAVTVSAGLQGEDGSFTVKTVGESEFQAVWALLSHAGTLIVQYPDDSQKFIRIMDRSFSQSGRLSSLLSEIKVGYVEVSV